MSADNKTGQRKINRDDCLTIAHKMLTTDLYHCELRRARIILHHCAEYYGHISFMDSFSSDPPSVKAKPKHACPGNYDQK